MLHFSIAATFGLQDGAEERAVRQHRCLLPALPAACRQQIFRRQGWRGELGFPASPSALVSPVWPREGTLWHRGHGGGEKVHNFFLPVVVKFKFNCNGLQ